MARVLKRMTVTCIGAVMVAGALGTGVAHSAAVAPVKADAPTLWKYGSELEIKNDSNLRGYTPTTFEIRTTYQGSDDTTEHHQATLKPGESWKGSGKNDGTDVRARLYVNNELRAVVRAINDNFGWPTVLSSWGNKDGQYYDQSRYNGIDEGITRTLAGGGLDYWLKRQDDSNDHKHWTVAIFSVPNDRTYDKKKSSSGGGAM